jgi:hypothetical protein
MRLAVYLFVVLFLWRLQPQRVVIAGLLGGLIWAFMESMYVYHTLTDMKRLVSPLKLTNTMKQSALRSVSMFLSRAMLFYVVNHVLTVTHVPLWSYAFGLSLGFYTALTLLWSYHRARLLVY